MVGLLNVGRLLGGPNLAAFNPRSLFSSGEQGAWYDPSDFSTMFQNAAGTIPVTAVEQPVGKILDKSGRGNHATQATEPSRPLLRQEATGQYYLAFDGSDDSLATGSIDFSATNKMSIFVGVRKLSDSPNGMLAELSSSFANPGTFALQAPWDNGSAYRFVSGGGSFGIALPTNPSNAPVTNVLTALGDISGDRATLRINGSQAAQSTSDQGTNSYGNYPLYIGRRNNSSLPFYGRLYSLIVRGAQSTDPQIASTESYVNTKTGAY